MADSMNKIKWFSKISIGFFILLSIVLINGCSDSVTTPTQDNIQISMISSGGLFPEAATLVLDSVKVLIKDIKLNVSGNSDSVNFRTGPFMFRLNPDGVVNSVSTAMIPAGSYDKIMFEIHKLEPGDVVDTIFNSGGGHYSVIAYGKIDGNDFIYRSSMSAKQKLNFPALVPVGTSALSRVTISVKPYSWFWDGTQYMDPRDAANENNIDVNIKASFRAFKDDNRDGIPD